jgi:hypothetical protein
MCVLDEKPSHTKAPWNPKQSVTMRRMFGVKGGHLPALSWLAEAVTAVDLTLWEAPLYWM